jgi:hypothetical protein
MEGEMERTESSVVQVAPQYENEKIHEMQGFGWNLQGRQEVHQEGEAYGRPSYTDSSTYIIKTKVHSYVKLHFVRALDLPHLNEIRQLEAEYFGQSFAQPPGMAVPGCFTLFGIVGVIVFAGMALSGTNSPPFQGGGAACGVLMYVVWVALGVFWWRSRTAKRQRILEANSRSAARMAEIRASVAQFL